MKFLTDENVLGAIVRGLRRRQPDIDLVRVQDTGLMATADPIILAWAAREERILLTHDADTMPYFAYQRIAAGQRMPGVLVLPRSASIGHIIEMFLVFISVSNVASFEDQVRYLPRE